MISAFSQQITRHFQLIKSDDVPIVLPSFHPKQQEIYDTQARYKVLVCGRKFGKTSYAEIDLCYDATHEAYPYGFCSLTYKTLSDSWRIVNNYLQGYIEQRDSSAKRLTLRNGSIIEFWSMDNPEPIRSKKYKKLIIDEVAAVRNLKYVWEDILSPTLAPFEGSAVFLSTPRGKLNHFYELFKMQQTDQDWFSWQLPTWLNPFIPAREIEAMRKRMSREAFAQEVEAQFTVREGAVFPNWDELENVTSDADYVEGYPIEWWVDVGYTNPTCILMAQERPFNGMPDHLCVFNEVYETQFLPADIIRDALRAGYLPPSKMFYDPAAPTFHAEFAKIRTELGFMCQILGGDNTPASTQALRQSIGDSQNVRLLRVHPRCKNLIAQIPDYHYNPNAIVTQAGDPRVEKANDHAVDAARYGHKLRIYK